MKGYKIFKPDFTAKEGNFQYAENKTFEMDLPIEICRSGFHFCVKLSHCFSYYNFDQNNIVCEVEALGDIQGHDEDSKICTNKLHVGRRLSWQEVLTLANDGKENTGHSNTGNSNTGDWNTGYSNTGNRNTGNRNTGDRNTGDWNTGYSNTGDRNTGDRNTGDWNTGDRNTGDWNTGDSNTGDSNTGNRNTGDRNTGDWNTGYSNTGNRNTGNRNTGDRNTGDWNTGYSNTGDRNTGNRNTGDRNTGYWNTGNRNTGYSNTGDRNTGAFCTGEKTMKFFDKDSDWTEEMFKNSKVYSLLCDVNTKMWIYPSGMTEEEKEKYPSYKTCDGYLKDIPFKEAFQNQWHNWSEENKNEFKKLPNFDAEIFELITGVKI
jgi:PPE-repeat protein